MKKDVTDGKEEIELRMGDTVAAPSAEAATRWRRRQRGWRRPVQFQQQGVLHSQVTRLLGPSQHWVIVRTVCSTGDGGGDGGGGGASG